jgi:hypothetical protein
MESLHPRRGSIQDYYKNSPTPVATGLTTVRCATDEILCGRTVFIAAPW